MLSRLSTFILASAAAFSSAFTTGHSRIAFSPSNAVINLETSSHLKVRNYHYD